MLDAGALLALEKRDKRMEALLRRAHQVGARILIPAGALAQVWSGDPRQAPVHRLLQRNTTEVPPLDRIQAEVVGKMCRRSGTADVVDASVVIVARQARAVIVSSDADDLLRLDPSATVERI